jgi:hypothetical protein
MLFLSIAVSGRAAEAADSFNVRVTVTCSVGADIVTGSRIGEPCNANDVTVDTGPLVVTLYDLTGACPLTLLTVGLNESASTRLPWCAGRYAVQPGSTCVDGKATFEIPPLESTDLRGEFVRLELRPRPCGSPKALHATRDDDQHSNAWGTQKAPRRAVRVWWQPPDSVTTTAFEAAIGVTSSSRLMMVEANVGRFGGSRVRVFVKERALLSKLAEHDLVLDRASLTFTKDLHALHSSRRRLRARSLLGALQALDSPVADRCYAVCTNSGALAPIVIQTIVNREMRWLHRRVPVELLDAATTSKGLAALLTHVGEQDSVWDTSAAAIIAP